MKIVAVVARGLAVIVHHVWSGGAEFRWIREAAATRAPRDASVEEKGSGRAMVELNSSQTAPALAGECEVFDLGQSSGLADRYHHFAGHWTEERS